MVINVAFPLDHEHEGGHDGDPFYEDPPPTNPFNRRSSKTDSSRQRVLGRQMYRHGAHLHGIRDASFGLVISSHSLEHFIDPLQVGRHDARKRKRKRK